MRFRDNISHWAQMRQFSFETDPETVRLFEVVVWCLKRYFNHTDESAVASVNALYAAHKHHRDDDFYHHEGAYWTALEIHFLHDLKGEPGRYSLWRMDNGYTSTPPEAAEYFREHYFKE